MSGTSVQVDGLLVATVAAFALLCAVALVRGLRLGHRPSLHLAVSFAALCTAATLVSRLDGVSPGLVAYVAVVATASGLLVHPIALVLFADSVEPVGAGVRRVLITLASLLLLAVLVVARDPAAFGDPGTSVGVTLLQGVALLWFLAATVATVSLLRAGRRLTSSVGRDRARTMAAGVLLLVPAVAVPFLVPDVPEVSGTGFALLASLVLYAGYAPPRWLRWVWARADMRDLATAELRAQRAEGDGITRWLEAATRAFDGRAAWLDVEGERVAGTVGADDPVARTIDLVAVANPEAVRTVQVGPRRWQVEAWVPGARLTVLTQRDPVLFGDRESQLLLLTCARMRGWAATERQRLEDLRQQEEEHQRASARLRDDVLSTLSHELRTPLVMLRGVPETLLAHWHDLDEGAAQHLVERARVSAMALQRLVETTVLLAQLRAGELPVRTRVVGPAEVVDLALARLARLGIPTDRVLVSLEGDRRCTVDPDLAATALAELVHNALTYSDDPLPVRITLGGGAAEVCLRVTDLGRGMPSASLDRLQGPFSRAGDVLTRDRRGLGLGLTIVTETLALVGGTLAVEPMAGSTTVVMSVPPASVEPRSAAS